MKAPARMDGNPDTSLMTAAIGAAGVTQGFGLYLAADWVERRYPSLAWGSARFLVIATGLVCLWPEITAVADWLDRLAPARTDLVWVFVIGTWLGTVLPRPGRSRKAKLPPDASIDEIEAD